MFSFRIDPGTAGAGVACTDAEAPDGSRLDFALAPDGGRGSAWSWLEAEVGALVLVARQVHGVDVLRVDAATSAAELAGRPADALVTTAARVAVAVQVADCVPVLFADADAGVVGAAHAGRVGLQAGVLAATVAALAELGAVAPTAWIGPHICGDCYEVPEALQQEFCAVHPAAATSTSWGTAGLDLGAAAAAQLSGLGCRVLRLDPCTRTTPGLHSYRRDGAAAGRQVALAWRA